MRLQVLLLTAMVAVLTFADSSSACGRVGLFGGRSVSVTRHVERSRFHLFPRLFHRGTVVVTPAPSAAPCPSCPTPMPPPAKKKVVESDLDSGVVVISSSIECSGPDCTGMDALDEVNTLRASRGLRPFIRDPNLTVGARAVAAFRAARGLFGHTGNDFSFLPPGASASAAGCAAYPANYGWMSCCTNDNYTYAGAAYVTGPDGRRFMHLFVR